MDSGGNVEIDEARRMVLDGLAPLPAGAFELDAALGRVLAEDIIAAAALPAFDSSAMDGFAVRAADVAHASESSPVGLRVIGESRAGRPARETLEAGQAIAISTGAVIPAGADAVVPVERTQREDGLVRLLAPVSAGADVRPAGEDVTPGSLVIARGSVLGAAELGMLASLGHGQVSCTPAPRVSVLVTGDELLAAGEPERPGAIRDSNSYAVAALARSAGAQVLRSEVVKDEEASTRAAIARAAEHSDVLVICGGVSVGEHDHVRPSLQALGARQVFWGLALRPGHPTWFGTLGRTLVFGLPGNPVSAMVTFLLLARPALRALQGACDVELNTTAVLDERYEKPAGRAHAVRCRLYMREDGWHARPTGPQRSNVLSSMLAADALAIIPSELTSVAAGQRVVVEPLRPWVRICS
jgi:molybdopterin molybdotransferase